MKQIIEKVVEANPQTLDELKAMLVEEMKKTGWEFSQKEYNDMFDEIVHEVWYK